MYFQGKKFISSLKNNALRSESVDNLNKVEMFNEINYKIREESKYLFLQTFANNSEKQVLFIEVPENNNLELFYLYHIISHIHVFLLTL